jgi:ABC-type glycerol-3-phosphate transport system substrate-binding protein
LYRFPWSLCSTFVCLVLRALIALLHVVLLCGMLQVQVTSSAAAATSTSMTVKFAHWSTDTNDRSMAISAVILQATTGNRLQAQTSG